jgi:hypothetical protein
MARQAWRPIRLSLEPCQKTPQPSGATRSRWHPATHMASCPPIRRPTAAEARLPPPRTPRVQQAPLHRSTPAKPQPSAAGCFAEDVAPGRSASPAAYPW